MHAIPGLAQPGRAGDCSRLPEKSGTPQPSSGRWFKSGSRDFPILQPGCRICPNRRRAAMRASRSSRRRRRAERGVSVRQPGLPNLCSRLPAFPIVAHCVFPTNPAWWTSHCVASPFFCQRFLPHRSDWAKRVGRDLSFCYRRTLNREPRAGLGCFSLSHPAHRSPLTAHGSRFTEFVPVHGPRLTVV